MHPEQILINLTANYFFYKYFIFKRREYQKFVNKSIQLDQGHLKGFSINEKISKRHQTELKTFKLNILKFTTWRAYQDIDPS